MLIVLSKSSVCGKKKWPKLAPLLTPKWWEQFQIKKVSECKWQSRPISLTFALIDLARNYELRESTYFLPQNHLIQREQWAFIFYTNRRHIQQKSLLSNHRKIPLLTTEPNLPILAFFFMLLFVLIFYVSFTHKSIGMYIGLSWNKS